MHKKFNYKSIADLEQDIKNFNLNLGCSEDLSILAKPVKLGNHSIPNALVAHPMEGGDCNEIGGPSDLTFRKYERVAEGGVGLVWLEAVSVNHEGRSNKRQLYLNEKSLPGFKELAARIYKAAQPIRPLTIVQLNHSGRYSKPEGKPAPIIASHIPELDERLKIDNTYPLTTDEYLESLIKDFVASALLVKEAGFDGVDIKACHGYLLHELLSCFDRDGKYGGSFEKRSKLMLDIIDRVREAIPDPEFIIASRINIYDALPLSNGWGMNDRDPDMREPIKLAQELVKRGVTLINITMGNPYFIPHINRPYDNGAYYPNEHPLEGVYRLIHYTREMQKAVPEAKFVGVGYSWLRQFSPNVAAWIIQTGGASLIGYGRQFIAYPDFAKDILENGGLAKNKVCTTCSKCSMLKRDIGTCGCVVRDSSAYLQLYKDTYQKTAVVTGAGKGIGRSIADNLGKQGYRVIYADIAPPDDPSLEYIRCDISNKAEREALLTTVIEKYRKVDLLVNNAGVAPLTRLDILETTEESFRRLMNINLEGTFFMCQLFANQMLKQAPNGGYRIINIASISSYTSSTARGEYCISKAGVSMTTQLFADRLAESGIGVFEIRPGIIMTDMTAGVKEKYERLIAEGITPIKRFGQPQDIADAVTAIAQGNFDFCTGQIFNVDGGFHLRRL